MDEERGHEAETPWQVSAGGWMDILHRAWKTHVLLSIEEYQRITGKRRSIVDALSMPGLADLEFDPPRSRDLARGADFS